MSLISVVSACLCLSTLCLFQRAPCRRSWRSGGLWEWDLLWGLCACQRPDCWHAWCHFDGNCVVSVADCHCCDRPNDTWVLVVRPLLEWVSTKSSANLNLLTIWSSFAHSTQCVLVGRWWFRGTFSMKQRRATWVPCPFHKAINNRLLSVRIPYLGIKAYRHH